MIARIWCGWASPETADDYERHYRDEVVEHLRLVSGFRGARLLRRTDQGRTPQESVMFTSITFFDGLDAVRAFAGEDYEQAVVEEAARRSLSRWDQRVAHHEVAVELY
jgi:heme-degrading monooxygenase HmoA